jgi:hypothetical protein
LCFWENQKKIRPLEVKKIHSHKKNRRSACSNTSNLNYDKPIDTPVPFNRGFHCSSFGRNESLVVSRISLSL